MAITPKDLTIFTFTRSDKIGSSSFYKLCEYSWRTAFPGAKIIKFDMDELRDQYKDIWFYKRIESPECLSCFYTDPLRVFKSIEIPNSMYLDSDVYICKSFLTVINRSIMDNVNFCGNCYGYFNNGETPEIKKLYNFYTGNHDRQMRAGVSKYGKFILDAEAWKICNLYNRRLLKFPDHVHLSRFTQNTNFFFVPCTIAKRDYNSYSDDSIRIKIPCTLVFVDAGYPYLLNKISDQIYITNNMLLFQSVAQEFGEANKREVKSEMLDINRLFPNFIGFEHKAKLLKILKSKI